ncbi:Zinc carboxypeptidase [Thalassobacillus cyri]|uniref:Zinc carboxypeptidase n=1 Tax=Thalassobacillus cyri TaxID=571932 RepID=A0A1H4ENH4_9BACI|nr:M14 family zinc carboxypeptidase [Thalassobacillus cyri]SEA86399.1 Zinc carboxypeptidase [Thalassobacillus cyri]
MQKIIIRALLLAVIVMGPLAIASTKAVLADQQKQSPFNSEHYDYVTYEEIVEHLKRIEKNSNRVSLEVVGQSTEGRDIYAVTISDPEAKGKYGKIQALRNKMFQNPEDAQNWVDKHPDFKVPIMIDGSIHGNEFVGSDAVLKLIERFAFENDQETKEILENNILIFNAIVNPDGRVNATRYNAEGIDLNRDYITQSQPETEASVKLLTEWNPMVFLDLHGYVNYSDEKPGLIEPTTPPHNPNYEYDLYSKWALDQAEAMEAEIVNNKESYETDFYQNIEGVHIPARDAASGWDDYPPIFAPMYAMYHGAYGATIEAPSNTWDGVEWQINSVMGALKFATENKDEMIKDQIEIFKRGINFQHPDHEKGFFPEAYVLPTDKVDPNSTLKAIEHLQQNDIEVEKAKQAFTLNGKPYEAGTFIVSMNQAKAGLANTILWDGEDISDDTSAMYDISAWSFPELWGFEAIPAQAEPDVQSVEINNIKADGELSGKGPYLIPNSSTEAVSLVNELLQNGGAVYKDTNGDFYVEDQPGSNLRTLVKDSGLTLDTKEIPAQAEPLKNVDVAILKDGGIWKSQSHSGTKIALEKLGFEVDEISPQQVAEQGLAGYDVFVYSGTESLISYQLSEANQPFGLKNAQQFETFQQQIDNFVTGGGKYIAVGAGASKATKTIGLTDVAIETGPRNSNGIVKVDYLESPLTAGYVSNDIGFVYNPVWYTNLNDQTLAASFAEADFFQAGFWKNSETAAGEAVIIQEKDKDVTLIGLEAGFRDHTSHLYRLLSNTIFE